jgi:hypothetical protein
MASIKQRRVSSRRPYSLETRGSTMILTSKPLSTSKLRSYLSAESMVMLLSVPAMRSYCQGRWKLVYIEQASIWLIVWWCILPPV